MIKLLVIGDSFSGKTSLLNRFVNNHFEKTYVATVACDFQLKIIKIDNIEIRIQLWDLAGQDSRTQSINKLFCRGAKGAIVMADITNSDSLSNTIVWKDQISEQTELPGGENIPMVLVSNKVDLLEEMDEAKLDKTMHQAYLDNFAEENGFIGAFRTSAKTGKNVSQVFAAMVKEILKADLGAQPEEDDDSIPYQKSRKVKPSFMLKRQS